MFRGRSPVPGRDEAGVPTARLLRVATVVVLGLVLVTVLMWSTTSATVLGGLGRQADDIAPRRLTNVDMLRSALDAESSVRNYLNTGDPSAAERYRDERDEFRSATGRSLSLVRPGSPDRALVLQQERVFERWVTDFARPALADRGEGAQPVDPDLARAGRELTDRIRVINDEERDRIEARARAVRSGMAQATRNARSATVASALLVAATILVAVRRLRRELWAPLDELDSTLDELTAGNLGARAPVHGLREARALSAAVNRLAGENQQMVTDRDRRLGRERLLRRLTALVRSRIEPAALLDLAAAAIGPAAGVDRVVVRAVEDDAIGPVESSWAAMTARGRRDEGALDAGAPPPDVLEAAAAAFAAGECLAVADTEDLDDPRWSASDRRWFAGQGVRSALFAPVMHRDQLLAVLALQALSGPRAWSDDDVALVEAVARELGVALSHGRLLEEQQALVARLKELDQAKSDFVSTVSHEIRTPITSIRGAVEMLLDGDAGPLGDDQATILAVAHRNAARLLALVEDLLTLANIESGSFRLTFGPVELGPLVREAADAVCADFDRRGVVLDLDLADGVVATGDRFQLERVVLNLLTNACKFSEPGGRVSVRLAGHAGAAVLTVEDEGLGMSADDLDRLFTRFFRTAEARERSIPGTGLGLTIVQNILEHHHGEITVRSRVGEGTEMTVRLPAAEGRGRPDLDVDQVLGTTPGGPAGAEGEREGHPGPASTGGRPSDRQRAGRLHHHREAPAWPESSSPTTTPTSGS